MSDRSRLICNGWANEAEVGGVWYGPMEEAESSVYHYFCFIFMGRKGV